MKKAFKKGKVLYRFEDDIFYARQSKREYDSSIQLGSFIFDLDDKGKINGIELLNASELLGTSKVFLNNIISGKIKIEVNQEIVKININLNSLVRNAPRSSVLNYERVRPDFLEPTKLNLAVA